jgi:hypothetical protein
MEHVIVTIGITMMACQIKTAWNATTNVVHAKILLIVLHVEEIKGKIFLLVNVFATIGITMMAHQIQTVWNATINVLLAKIFLFA